MWIILIVAVFFIWAVVSWINDQEKAKEQQKREIDYAEQKNADYRNKIKSLSNKIAAGEAIEKQPVVNVVTVGYRENIYYLPHYVWIKDNILHFFPTGKNGNYDNHTGEPRHMHTYSVGVSDMKLISIPVDKIMFYRQIGSVYTTTTGYGGQSSHSPITGFHGKINPIVIKSQVHDERTTQIFYGDNSSNRVVVLDDKDYYVLRRLIPQKDYQVVTISASAREVKGTDEFERLKKVNEMHKAGLISDADYEQKKSEILSKM